MFKKAYNTRAFIPLRLFSAREHNVEVPFFMCHNWRNLQTVTNLRPMKFFLLFSFFIASTFSNAQSGKVADLPIGVYEVQKAKGNAPFSGDIVLLNDSQYKLRNGSEVYEYKFSATAQRVLFISGPLKGVYAKTVLNAGAPAIVLPKKENEELGYRFAEADVWAFYKRQ
jgi:hypothetical protein